MSAYGPWRGLWDAGKPGQPVDVVTRVFVLAMAALTLALAGRVAAWPLLVGADGLVLVLVGVLVRVASANRFAAVVALWYPYLLISAYYGQLGVLGLEAARVHDREVQAWEAGLFGSQLSVTWHRAMPWPLLAWVLNLAYIAHYFIILGVPLVLWWRAGREASARAIFAVTLTFFACFLFYAAYPVAGPDYVFPRGTGPESLVLPARLVRALLEGGSSYGTAFPSSHVAASWCAVVAAWRDARGLAVAVAPVALLLAAGTVYGQYHYAVDALAGGATGIACFALAEWLRPRLASRPA